MRYGKGNMTQCFFNNVALFFLIKNVDDMTLVCVIH